MRLPRDLSGTQLAHLPRRYGYEISRQTGSHIRLSSRAGISEHHISIPAHGSLKVGTLSSVLSEVASNLGMQRAELAEKLFQQ